MTRTAGERFRLTVEVQYGHLLDAQDVAAVLRSVELVVVAFVVSASAGPGRFGWWSPHRGKSRAVVALRNQRRPRVRTVRMSYGPRVVVVLDVDGPYEDAQSVAACLEGLPSAMPSDLMGHDFRLLTTWPAPQVHWGQVQVIPRHPDEPLDSLPVTLDRSVVEDWAGSVMRALGNSVRMVGLSPGDRLVDALSVRGSAVSQADVLHALAVLGSASSRSVQVVAAEGQGA